MRTSATLFSCFVASLLSAQDCLFNFLTETTPVAFDYPWISRQFSLHPSGNISYSQTAFGMAIGQLAPDGQLLWDRRVAHMNPVSAITPSYAQPRPGGGHYMYGRFDPDLVADVYYNQCAVAMAPNGAMEWARIYMTDTAGGGSIGLQIRRMNELPGGDIMMTASAQNTLGLARLDAGGVPIWHRRYVLPGTLLLVSDCEVENDGSMTVLCFTELGDMTLLRVAGDGMPVWSYTYAMSGNQWSGDLLRYSDGTYYTLSNSGTIGFITHFNSDGTFDWQKRLGATVGGVSELTSGDLLMKAGGGLLLVSPAASPLQAWSSIIPGATHGLIAERNDSIFLFHRDQSGGTPGWSALQVSTSLNDLDCAFSTANVPLTFPEPPATLVSSTIGSFADQLKTWTMNVGAGLTIGQLDVQAAAGSGPARPGFSYMVYTDALNNGGTASGALTRTITFDPLLTYVNASTPPSSVTASTITWNAATAVAGYDNSLISVEFTIPPDVQLLGTDLVTTFTATQGGAETDLANNTTTITRTITGSYDPNDKLVQPSGTYHIENDSLLTYTIRFQNTGNDTAFTVVVRDTLPLDLDVSTFKLGATSHPCTYTLLGNGLVTFTFADILLPDSNTNEALSHGQVNFSIKPLQPLALGQVISNAADIYFDFNPPIRTPDAVVVVTDQVGMVPVARPLALSVYPVPARDLLNARVPEGFTPEQAVALGADGRRIQLARSTMPGQAAQWNVQQLAPGAYVLHLTDRSGNRMSARFTKE